MPSCIASGMPSYPKGSVIEGNTLVDNGGGIFLWQNSDRYCNDGFDGVCTLTRGGAKGPFSWRAARRTSPMPLSTAARTVGEVTGSPPQNYWDGLHVGDAERDRLR